MHELSVTQGILNSVNSKADQLRAKSVKKIKLVMGSFYDYVPEIMRQYYEMLSEGTVSENALLEFDIIPVIILCKDCNNISETKSYSMRCLKCGSKNIEYIQGKEFFIDSIEIEDL